MIYRSQLACGLCLVLGTMTVMAAPINVDQHNLQCNDSAGPVFCSIQAALNKNPLAAMVLVKPGHYRENLSITSTAHIRGVSRDQVIISAKSPETVIRLMPGSEARLSGLSIRGGTATNGGGISNAGSLQLSDCIIEDNNAEEKGGGIYNGGALSTSLQINNCIIRNNSVLQDDSYNVKNGGGGIYNAAPLHMRDSQLHGNRSADNGGAIYSVYSGRKKPSEAELAAERLGLSAPTRRIRWLERPVEEDAVVLDGLVIQGNNAENGGGISLHGVMILKNSRVEENRADLKRISSGGGISTHFDSRLQIHNSLIAHNYASLRGGGIRYFSTKGSSLRNTSIIANEVSRWGRGGGLFVVEGSRELSMSNSVISDNTLGHEASNECDGLVFSLGHNLLALDTHCQWRSANGDMLGNRHTPLYARLQYKAGQWQVPADSPIVDNGNNLLCDQPLDIYHKTRIVDGNGDGSRQCDIGALEYQAER